MKGHSCTATQRRSLISRAGRGTADDTSSRELPLLYRRPRRALQFRAVAPAYQPRSAVDVGGSHRREARKPKGSLPRQWHLRRSHRASEQTGERSRDVGPRVYRRANCLGAIQPFSFRPSHGCGEFVGRQAHRNDLCRRGATWSATPAGTELVDVVTRLSLSNPLVDLRLVDLTALDDALHKLIVIRKRKPSLGEIHT